MSKRLLPIGAGILAIILIVVIVAVAASRKPQSTPQSQTSTPAKTENAATSGSLKSLLSGGKNQTCQVSYTVSGQTVAGTVYVAGGNKMRGDFTLTGANNVNMDSHMIVDAGWGYFWTSASPAGTKMKIEGTSPTPAAGSASQGADLNREMEYKCSDWSPDSSKFTPPSNIQFTDLTQTATNLQNQATTTTPDLKSVCDQITDPQTKAACLSALK